MTEASASSFTSRHSLSATVEKSTRWTPATDPALSVTASGSTSTKSLVRAAAKPSQFFALSMSQTCFSASVTLAGAAVAAGEAVAAALLLAGAALLAFEAALLLPGEAFGVGGGG